MISRITFVIQYIVGVADSKVPNRYVVIEFLLVLVIPTEVHLLRLL